MYIHIYIQSLGFVSTHPTHLIHHRNSSSPSASAMLQDGRGIWLFIFTYTCHMSVNIYIYIYTYVQIPNLLLHGVQSPSFVLDMDQMMPKWIKRFKQVRMTMKTCQRSLGDVLCDNFQVFLGPNLTGFGWCDCHGRGNPRSDSPV